MAIPRGFYTTKVMLEVTVSHQFDHNQGIGIVLGLLNSYHAPAIQGVRLVGAESNFVLHQAPAKEMKPVTVSPFTGPYLYTA